ncbi:unnamed protein product [Onchocerca ochengi]|uniref:Uncharacterized protein n=2 Tax=Onchocerca TaxID=6281 RepID=A0A182ECL1_ONCOC|nr:unnamed protein product [Onchocerca ochengi]
MYRERLNFESRSISFPLTSKTKSFKRNSVRALKNNDRRPGGLEMILASVDESLDLLSDLIGTTRIDDSKLRNHERNRWLFTTDLANHNEHDCTIWKIDKKVDNCVGSKKIEKSSSQSKFLETAKIDLTGEEIIQWMGGLPMINSNKMLAYFCGGTNQETKKKILSKHEPYKIFSFTQKQQFIDQITTRNLINQKLFLRIHSMNETL